MPEHPDPELFCRAVELASGFINHRYQKEYKNKIEEYYKQLLEKRATEYQECLELNRKFNRGKCLIFK
jgi:hypothetical protein